MSYGLQGNQYLNRGPAVAPLDRATLILAQEIRNQTLLGIVKSEPKDFNLNERGKAKIELMKNLEIK